MPCCAAAGGVDPAGTMPPGGSGGMQQVQAAARCRQAPQQQGGAVATQHEVCVVQPSLLQQSAALFACPAVCIFMCGRGRKGKRAPVGTERANRWVGQDFVCGGDCTAQYMALSMVGGVHGILVTSQQCNAHMLNSFSLGPPNVTLAGTHVYRGCPDLELQDLDTLNPPSTCIQALKPGQVRTETTVT
jgi:hypothetical protein